MTTTRQFRQIRFTRPPGATELLLVRHGESAAAVPDQPFALVGGQGDPELAPEGRAQAERLGARLGHEHIDAIYVTNLRRTHETAAPLAARLALKPVIEADLREVHLGEWEGGVFRQKVMESDPIAVRMREEQRWDVIPGAEPAEAFAARVKAAVERIAGSHPDQRVAVFTHGGTIGQIVALASGSRPLAFGGSDNASISHLVVVDSSWIIRRFNDTAHLEVNLSAEAAPLT